MARINGVSYPGITVQKDWKGNISDITINIKRCSDEVKELLKSIGIIKNETIYDPEYVAEIKRRQKEGNFVRIDSLDEFFTSI